MNKDEIIALLQQQISFLQEQLQEANRKADALLEEVTSLRNLLEHKSEEEAKQKRIIKGLAKITQNKSEKQTPTPASQDTTTDQPSEKKERARTNNGAKRKQHLEVEVVEEDIEPEDPRFNKEQARLYKTRDVIRYELIPMRFIKKIYHVGTISMPRLSYALSTSFTTRTTSIRLEKTAGRNATTTNGDNNTQYQSCIS